MCKINVHQGNIYTYADDTAVLVHGTSWDQVKNNAEDALRKITKWLNINLLTLNLEKTNYVPFSIRKNTKPPNSFTLQAHSCHSFDDRSCDCQVLTRSNSVKYLGIQIDDSLNWEKQINVLSGRVTRLIHVFKALRNSAGSEVLKMTYLALCQSIISYCIPAWGGTTKTLLLKLERAQRAVIKVMLHKPFRYPTKQLYSDCKLLTVRQLFILNSILRRHRSISPSRPNKRRNNPKSIPHRTSFAKHQFYVLGTYIYSKLNNMHNLSQLNRHELKLKLSIWLLTLNYQDTEEILTFIR